MTDSPWMTRGEVAEYARCSTVTVYRAWTAYRQSGGARGLRGVQPNGANATLRFHRDDVARWVLGQVPVNPRSRSLRRSA